MFGARLGPLVWVSIYLGGWLVYASMYATALSVRGATPVLSVRVAIANLLPEALLGILLLRLPQHSAWRRGGAGRLLVLHSVTLVAFILLATAGWLALGTLDHRIFEGTWELPFSVAIVPWRLLTDVLVYGMLVGIALAVAQARTSRQLADRAARAEALQARSELANLRTQLQPHFVLNTLHSLLGLVRRDPALVETGLERLGDLLRYGLRAHRSEADKVLLAEEMATVRAYLELEHLRLGDRLQVGFEVDPETLSLEIPTFALQTLVENAVRHGIETLPVGGRLRISARREGSRLKVTVDNDAPSSSQGHGVGGPVSSGGEGIGLRLLAERIAVLYGDDGEIVFRPAPGFFRAELDLPASESAEAGPGGPCVS